MTHTTPPPSATWLHLSDESWAEIRDEYLAGATARQIALKWKIGPSTVYDRAAKGGWGKKTAGDAAARAHREMESQEVLTRTEAIASAFDLVGRKADGTPEDPAALGHCALEASSVAIRFGDYTLARDFARLSEIYFRIAPLAAPEFLSVIADAALDPRTAERLMSQMPGEKHPVKNRFWQLRCAQIKKENEDGWAERALRDKLAAYERAYGPLPGSQATPVDATELPPN
jgi:hypothetical protein